MRYAELWIKQINSMNDFDCVIMSDLRFPWELEWIKSHNGRVIRLEAPQRNEHRLHQQTGGDKKVMDQIRASVSETSLDHVVFSSTIPNDPGNEHVLLDHVKQFAITLFPSW